MDCPHGNRKVTIPLLSSDDKEQFELYLRRGKIDLMKGTYQNHTQEKIVLVRLDFGNSRHRNPDGKWIDGPHLHRYREGYGDKWAYGVPSDKFKDLKNPQKILEDFMAFCNIVKPPKILGGLEFA